MYRSLGVAITLIIGVALLSMAQTPQTPKAVEPKTADQQAMLVDYKSDVTLSRGDQIIRFVGNVLFHHNGAIIQCDSMLKYDEYRADFMGRVLISQDSTYIYGDRVYYDGRTAQADVYAPIVKMTRGDITLYTYQLSFNTKSQVGSFSGGGVITQRENLMESTRGEYNSKTNVVKFLDSVSLRSNTYLIRTDSLSYNLDAEQATFLARSYIWDHDRDFLRADWGDYYAKDSTYIFTRDAYVMTEDREMWADTMRYNTALKQAFMFSNAQILDTVNCSLMFGDWAFYDDSLGKAVLTLTPSVRGWQAPDTTTRYDTLGRKLPIEKIDTTYMRGDSILLFTFEPGKSKEGVRRMLNKRDTVPAIDTTIIKIDTMRLVDTLTIFDSVAMRDSVIISTKIQFDSTFSFRDTIAFKDYQVADTVEKERVVRSYHHVRMWNKGYQAVCDSMVSFAVDSTATMYIKPILWNETNQITSEQMDLYTKNEALDWADFTGEPFIAKEAWPGDTLHYDQASGTRLRAYFLKNDIDNAYMTGNVMNLYYKEEKGRLETLASIDCANLRIMFVKREPSRMIWGGSGSAAIYPIEKIPESQKLFLEGFTWQDSLRPQSALEICRRVERPTIRSVAETYHKPTFAISIELNLKKEELIKAATWSDRTDLPSVTPDFFQQSDFLF